MLRTPDAAALSRARMNRLCGGSPSLHGLRSGGRHPVVHQYCATVLFAAGHLSFVRFVLQHLSHLQGSPPLFLELLNGSNRRIESNDT